MPKKKNIVPTVPAAPPMQKPSGPDEVWALLEQVGVRLDQLGVRLGQTGVRLDQLGVRLDQLGVRLDQLGVRMDQTRAMVVALAEDDAKTRRRIEEAEEARGRAAETMFRHALPAVLKKAGFGEVQVEPRRLRRLDREYDFVARNGRANFVGEVKVRFRKKHIAQLTRLLDKFRADYPGKAGDRAIYGVVCGLVVDEAAAEIARNEGLLVVEGRAAAELRVHPRRLKNYAR